MGKDYAAGTLAYSGAPSIHPKYGTKQIASQPHTPILYVHIVSV